MLDRKRCSSDAGSASESTVLRLLPTFVVPNSCYLPQQARIHPTVVKKLLQLHWNKDPAADGAKINPDAAVLTAEYLRLFVIGEVPRLALMVASFL